LVSIEVKRPTRIVDTCPHLASKLRMSGAMLLLPQYTFIARKEKILHIYTVILVVVAVLV